jgi:hypothetical protein
MVGPAWAGLAHTVVLWLAGLILVNVCLYGFKKIPFTCSYLPGKTHLPIAFMTGFATLMGVVWLSVHELTAIQRPTPYLATIAGLALAAAAAHWYALTSVRDEDVTVQFEAIAPPAVQLLGLTRDGVTVIP